MLLQVTIEEKGEEEEEGWSLSFVHSLASWSTPGICDLQRKSLARKSVQFKRWWIDDQSIAVITTQYCGKWVRRQETAGRSLIFQGNFLFVLWVLGNSVVPSVCLLILTTTSWSLIEATSAFECFIRMATTSKLLELGIFSGTLGVCMDREGRIIAGDSAHRIVIF